MIFFLLVVGCDVRNEELDGREGPVADVDESSPGSAFTAVAAASGFACGLNGTGQTECWATGPERTAGVEPCAQFEFESWQSEGLRVRAIGAGWDSLCVITEAGGLRCTAGADGFAETPPDGTFVDVVLAYGHGCALDAAGVISCWGTRRDSVRGPHAGPYIDVSAHMFTACGLRADGAVDCWGEIDGIDEARMVGPYSTISGLCGRRTDGVVECWRGEKHPLGSTPMRAFASGNGTCGIDEVGELHCDTDWWDASWGSPPADGTFTQVSMSSDYETACALGSDGSVDCWGSKTMGCYKHRSWQ